ASVDLLRAEAEVARARVVVARANGALLSARGNLAAALGAQEFQVDARADAASERPAAALEPIDDAGAQALAHDPELRAAQAELTAQEAQTRVVAAEDRPELFASASLSGRAGGAPLSSGATVSGGGLLPSVPNWDLGVVFQLPVYDGVARARVDAARERERSVRAEVAAVRARVIAQVQFAWAGARTAEDTLPELQRATDAARANQQQVSARFVSGLGSTVDVVDAEALLIDAEVQLALGTFEVLRARARLARLTAQELP
ncbi:MAG: TolC family protein, partial [Deltaproteobacteria bacterium]|nr:TolC family protein [Deltaproteobacteria bacterium]